MLMAVKKEVKIMFLSIKYAVMRELLNKVTFFTNILFMILNNACMIVQWVVIFSIKNDMGGFTLRQILLLWGIASGTYGVAHFFFKRAFKLSETINNGKLDAYIVQPKNVLLSAITSDVEVSALGDLLYGYIAYIIYGFTIKGFILFTLFIVTGGIILTNFVIILHSLSFWFNNTTMLADTGNSLMVNFATYPDGIFKGLTKVLLFTIIPVGIYSYIPVKVIINFNANLFMINILGCILSIILAYIIFYKGLKRYSSSNLMSARI